MIYLLTSLLFSTSVKANPTSTYLQQLNQILNIKYQIQFLRREQIQDHIAQESLVSSEEQNEYLSRHSYSRYQREKEINNLSVQQDSMVQSTNTVNPASLDFKRFDPLIYVSSVNQYRSQVNLYNPAKLTLDPKHAFYHQSNEGISSVTVASTAKFLPDPIDAFIRKVELLSGQKLPRAVVESAQFNFPLNFSRAPRLKSLLVSSLFLRGDYSGRMIEEILKYHASRGVTVKVMVSATATWALGLGSSQNVPKDNGVLQRLEAAGVQVQRVSYQSPRSGSYEFDSLHRAHHAKLIVMEAENSRLSRIIVGGRNLSDAYVFMRAPDHSRYPDLVQYTSYAYTPVEDLDLELGGSNLVEYAKTQFHDFWFRPATGIVAESAFITLPAAPVADALMARKIRSDNALNIRHFFTSPFFGKPDQPSLEGIFIQAIQSAKRKIRIATPYFNPPISIVNAIKQAADRGVQVEILTNLVFGTDDYAPEVVAAANRFGLKNLLDSSTVFAWNDPTMFHSKTMCIDDELVYVGSANMNRRSFTHDVENGIFAYSKDLCRQYNQIFENRYLPRSKPTNARELEGQRHFLNDSLIRLLRGLF